MAKLGIMGALPEEVELITGALDEKTIEEYAGVQYHIGKRGRTRLVVCCGGMGKANAASTAQVLISHFGVTGILFSGIAGNMSSSIGIGDVVVGKELVYHDGEDEMFSQSAPYTAAYQSDPLYVDAAIQACRVAGVKFIVGRIATGDQFVGDAAVKRAIQEKCHPDCVEMEGAAVGQVAMRNKVPFVVLRAMSDNSDVAIDKLRENEAFQFNAARYAKTAAAIMIDTVEALEGM